MRNTLMGILFILVFCNSSWGAASGIKKESVEKCSGLGHWEMIQCMEKERKDNLLKESKGKNPITPDEESLENGKMIFYQYCYSCHGLDGKGKGPAAEYLGKQLPDLSGSIVQNQSDGEMFRRITKGANPMPEFGEFLTKDKVWTVINYLRLLSSDKRKDKI